MQILFKNIFKLLLAKGFVSTRTQRNIFIDVIKNKIHCLGNCCVGLTERNNNILNFLFVSKIKQVQASQEAVYSKISDLSNLQVLKERMANPDAQARIAEQMGQDKVDKMAQYLDNVSFDTDTITFGGSPVGDICLKVVEREEPKCVKMEGQGTPIPLNLWIQVVPNGDDASAIRVTLRAELNFFIRQMVSKPLQQAADGIAEMLARIDYNDNNNGKQALGEEC